MQGLLARLKRGARDQNTDGGDPTQANRGEKANDGISGLMLNNFMREKDVSNQLERKDVQQDYESVESVIEIPDSRSNSRTDDAIDIVIAMNKVPKSRKSSTTGTKQGKKLTKSRGSRGSRVSLNSVSLSEKDDLEVSGLESDDDGMSTQRTSLLSSGQAWAAFEEAVKNIDSQVEYFTKKPKPNFVASNDFQHVMMDMYGNTEYGNTKGYTLLKKKLNGMARASTLATKVFAVAAAKGQEDRLQEETKQDVQDASDDVDDVDGESEPMTHVFAKRGWRMLKRQVNENVMEQKTQSTKLNWTMLQHTLKQMTNVERTRQDLYERYGIVPVVKEDGTMTCENQMLSERARALLQMNKDKGKENRRPHSYQPTPFHLRSQSQTSYTSKDKIYKGAKLPSVKTKKRPTTAKSSYT